jgi:hypothetical protein
VSQRDIVGPPRATARLLLWIVPAALFASALASAANAHTRSMSYSTWQLADDGAKVELRLKLVELTRQPPGHPWPQILPQELRLFAGDEPCRAGEATRRRPAPEGWAVFHWRVHCEQPSPDRIESQLMRDVASAHTHFLRIDPPTNEQGAGIREQVLITGRDGPFTFSGDTNSAAPATVLSYVGLGGLHIATGWDHLAFVLALVLLAGSLREVAGLVTGFTLGHSLTLALAVMGFVRPDVVAVEVLIGFSIALVAAENTWLLSGRGRAIPVAVAASLLAAAALAIFGAGALGPVSWLGLALFSACHFGLLRTSTRPAVLRAAIAFAFGLVHGFGFAGILMEFALPTARLLPALFGFNLGVELGQLAVVVAIWPLLSWLSRTHLAGHRLIAETGSAAIFGLGLFWLLGRNF